MQSAWAPESTEALRAAHRALRASEEDLGVPPLADLMREVEQRVIDLHGPQVECTWEDIVRAVVEGPVQAVAEVLEQRPLTPARVSLVKRAVEPSSS